MDCLSECLETLRGRPRRRWWWWEGEEEFAGGLISSTLLTEKTTSSMAGDAEAAAAVGVAELGVSTASGDRDFDFRPRFRLLSPAINDDCFAKESNSDGF